MDQNKALELYNTLLQKKARRGLDDLFFFNKYIVEQDEKRRNYIVPHVHKEWSDWYKASNARIKMILVPRGCFKSTFFTVGRSLQALAQDRNHRILIANATSSNATKFLGEIKDHIQKNEIYKSLYEYDKHGKHLPMYNKNLTWNEDEIIIDGRDLGIKESTITAMGVGAGLASQHYSLIIADDLVNEVNSATKLQSDKVIDWWKRAFSLLDYDGEMVIIGTRWSYYELYSYILDDPMLSKNVDFYIRGAYKKDGSLYFPELLNEEKLEELKYLQGSYLFSTFYLNDPVDEDSALIKHSQIKYWITNEERNALLKTKEDTDDKVLPSNLNIFMVCDPAISQAVRADYSSIVVVGVDSDNNWYVLETRRGKWTVGAYIDEIFAAHKEWKPITTSIEVIGQSQGLQKSIYDEEDKRNYEINTVWIKSRPRVKKETRIRAVLQKKFERGKIFIRRDMFDLEDELLHFPKSAHDDLIDPLTDVQDIGFAPEDQVVELKETGSKLQNRLIIPQKDGNVDPVMGEYY